MTPLLPLLFSISLSSPFPLQDVANAIGAALGTVGGMSDLIENLEEVKKQLPKEEGEKDEELEKRAREVALNRGKESARNKVLAKGG